MGKRENENPQVRAKGGVSFKDRKGAQKKKLRNRETVHDLDGTTHRRFTGRAAIQDGETWKKKRRTGAKNKRRSGTTPEKHSRWRGTEAMPYREKDKLSEEKGADVPLTRVPRRRETSSSDSKDYLTGRREKKVIQIRSVLRGEREEHEESHVQKVSRNETTQKRKGSYGVKRKEINRTKKGRKENPAGKEDWQKKNPGNRQQTRSSKLARRNDTGSVISVLVRNLGVIRSDPGTRDGQERRGNALRKGEMWNFEEPFRHDPLEGREPESPPVSRDAQGTTLERSKEKLGEKRILHHRQK